MGKTLSLTVVAEGVETEEQMEFLRQCSCAEMQKFYFSKPIPPEEFASLLIQHSPSSVLNKCACCFFIIDLCRTDSKKETYRAAVQ